MELNQLTILGRIHRYTSMRYGDRPTASEMKRLVMTGIMKDRFNATQREIVALTLDMPIEIPGKIRRWNSMPISVKKFWMGVADGQSESSEPPNETEAISG